MPKDWAVRLHEAFRELCTNLDVPIRVLQHRLLLFERCYTCVPYQYPDCEAGDDGCMDHIKLMRLVQPHYSGMRTTLRLIYQMRQDLFWLMRVAACYRKGDWEELLILNVDDKGSGALPLALRQKVAADDVEEATSCHSQAAVMDKYGKKMQLMRKLRVKLPSKTCDVCHCVKYADKVNNECRGTVPGHVLVYRVFCCFSFGAWSTTGRSTMTPPPVGWWKKGSYKRTSMPTSLIRRLVTLFYLCNY